ncbi:hypothetical protein BU14_0582s0003 [Porphyra umbilicalis]|uniref:Uncharacterized protein n=1 Tax=Porphyra umbilicalis TaxID=2786 RepID=A0A1X6NRG1_PORUM|nr:hypothetical protein BU14_0582s0003 [Porphyra umbilicalis]|eukprot:OSX71167.1 hypothetical protein BU14_0582s0003 [Porphyra umbilicalis]
MAGHPPVDGGLAATALPVGVAAMTRLVAAAAARCCHNVGVGGRAGGASGDPWCSQSPRRWRRRRRRRRLPVWPQRR